MKKEIVMVTGAAGFIGSHLIEALLAKGLEVHAFDIVNLEECNNLSEVKDHQDFHYFQGDIRNKDDLDAFFCPEATRIFHLASVVGVNLYMEEPLALIDIALIGTRDILAKCLEHNVRMLYTSTSEVYGRNPNVPWKETDDRVLGPTSVDRWCYSTSKAMIEHMLFGAHRKYNWPFSIIRFFNVYGPRQNPIFVASKSIKRALLGQPLEMYDGGEQTRCFSYIDDVIEGVILASEMESAIGEVFNLGNDQECTIREVLESVIHETGGVVKLEDVDTKERYGEVYEDIGRRVPDVNKARKYLGFEPKTQMPEGVKKMVVWAKDNPWYWQE